MVSSRVLLLAAFGLALIGVSADAQEIARGVVIDAVTAADDPTQSYALYLPSDYTPDRAWNLLLAFHPGARGSR